MKVDPNEILFLKQNAPIGMIRVLANNIHIPYEKVRNEMITLKEDYTDSLVIEARRLLKEMTGLVYSEHQEA